MLKFLLIFLLVSCGSPQSNRYPVTGQNPVPPGDDTDDDELDFKSDIKPLLQTYCADCHNNDTFISSENSFLSSKAPIRISNKSMPQRQGKNAAKFGDAQRAIFAEFVADKK